MKAMIVKVHLEFPSYEDMDVSLAFSGFYIFFHHYPADMIW